MEGRISTGTEVLDELLEGGYENDAITTIYGPAGTGKTNLALLAAVSMAQKGKKVIYIDTEGGFSIARLKQIVHNPKKVLNKIMFLRPTNFEEQKKAFAKLKNIKGGRIGLIVVDTIAMLYRLQRSNEDIHEVNRELGMQIGILNEICRKHRIPVVITNQVYSEFATNRVNMVGGDILKYGSKCLVELQALASGWRKAILRKHRSIAGEKEALFRIVDKGISGK
ncbi:MAG: DNA repair and recombination protein RadB [Candidatus Woesearchaeota archaeon]